MEKQHTKRARRKRSGGEKAIKFRCDYSSTPLKVLESRGWTRIYDPKDRGWDLWWCDASEIKLALEWGQGWERLRAQQRVAHFLNHGELTRKNLLYRNLRRYKRLLLKAGKPREAALCDIMPVSFELPSEYRMLVEEYRRSQGATWIVKPAAGSQGRGIFLFQRLRDLQEWRAKEYPAPSPDDSDVAECSLPIPPDVYVVQKYIDDPYLLGGCKFDMRIYVLVTSFQPLKVWLAREGFARLSGEQFSLERINDSRVHLTNMSIQLKASANSGTQSDPAPTPTPTPSPSPSSPPVKLGSKWPLSCLRQYLTERHGAAVVDDLLHNIAGMADVLVSYNNRRTLIPINDRGNLFASSLKCHFPSADGLTYADEDGQIQSVAVASEEFLLNPTVKEYFVYCSNKAYSHSEKASSPNECPGNCNKENEPNAVIDEKRSEESTKNEIQEAVFEKPAKVKNTEQILRVGWLNRAAGERKYRKMRKPRGGVKKLKLDSAAFYSAHQIKRMAIEAYEASSSENSAIEEELSVSLGDFGGQEIAEFRRVSDGRLCDIWEYCRERGKRLYQLNLFMLTSPIDEERAERAEPESCRTISTRRRRARPRVENELRVLYLYARRSSYSEQMSYIEYEKPQLHERVLDDHCGDGPPLAHFEPSDYGCPISRIERGEQLLLQRCFGEEDEAAGYSIEFPASQAEGSAEGSLEEHSVLHDLDRLQGHCNSKFGIGFVPSCGTACKPLFSWYRDGLLFRQLEALYWLDDVKDAQPRRWSCIVSCRSTDRQLRSKEILVDGLQD